MVIINVKWATRFLTQPGVANEILKKKPEGRFVAAYA